MSSPAQAAAPARANQQQRRRRQQQQQGESQSAAVPRVAGLARRGLRGVRSLPRNPAEAIARAEERARGLDGPGGGSSKAESCREAKALGRRKVAAGVPKNGRGVCGPHTAADGRGSADTPTGAFRMPSDDAVLVRCDEALRRQERERAWVEQSWQAKRQAPAPDEARGWEHYPGKALVMAGVAEAEMVAAAQQETSAKAEREREREARLQREAAQAAWQQQEDRYEPKPTVAARLAASLTPAVWGEGPQALRGGQPSSPPSSSAVPVRGGGWECGVGPRPVSGRASERFPVTLPARYTLCMNV